MISDRPKNGIHISIMSVDVFGRTLIRANQVQRGPPGIGFILTEEGNFDVEKRKLCNVASATDSSDAVTLDNLKHIENNIKNLNQSLEKLETKFMTEVENLKSQIQEKTVYVKDYYFTNKFAEKSGKTSR